MAIINDFKAIRAACDAISKDILGPKKQPEDELEIEFEADDEFEEKLNPVPAPAPRWPGNKKKY